jgi:hypothetical protein
MAYDKKLCVQRRTGDGLVDCKACKKRNVRDWNIYKKNVCSSECQWLLISKTLATA